jgi:hypothetical protein
VAAVAVAIVAAAVVAADTAIAETAAATKSTDSKFTKGRLERDALFASWICPRWIVPFASGPSALCFGGATMVCATASRWDSAIHHDRRAWCGEGDGRCRVQETDYGRVTLSRR